MPSCAPKATSRDMDFPTRDRYRQRDRRARARIGPHGARGRPARDCACRQSPGSTRGHRRRTRTRSRATTSSRADAARSRRPSDFALPIANWRPVAITAAAASAVTSAAISRGRRRRPRRAARRGIGIAASVGWTLVVLAVLAVISDIGSGRRRDQPRPSPMISMPRPCRHWSCATACRRICARWSSFRHCLTSRAGVDEQIERLEVHHLASRDGDLRFALLSDWTDSATETTPGDDALFDAAVDGIAQLNRRYGRGLRRRRVSSCFIGGGSGTRVRARGSAGNASGGSCTS